MNEHWSDLIVRTNPSLFLQTFRGTPFAPGLPACGDGWRDIVSRLVARVRAASLDHPVQFTQISERHGHLIVNWKAGGHLPSKVELAVEEAVGLAGARAACTCATCGSAGSLFSSGARLVMACQSHAAGVPVPTIAGFHDVYVLRTLVDRRPRLVRCTYDRDFDTFVLVESAAAEVAASGAVARHRAGPT